VSHHEKRRLHSLGDDERGRADFGSASAQTQDNDGALSSLLFEQAEISEVLIPGDYNSLVCTNEEEKAAILDTLYAHPKSHQTETVMTVIRR
jgi:hypothetical protein